MLMGLLPVVFLLLHDIQSRDKKKLGSVLDSSELRSEYVVPSLAVP